MLHSIWAASRNYKIQPEDHFGLLTSTGFAASNGPIYGSLLNGATVLPYGHLFTLTDLAQWIDRRALTLLLSRRATRSLGNIAQVQPTQPKLEVARVEGRSFIRPIFFIIHGRGFKLAGGTWNRKGASQIPRRLSS